MTPERWQRVKGVVADAMDRPLAERAQFLAAACGDDTTVRVEAAAIISQSADILERCAEKMTASASQYDAFLGVRLGAYEVVREIGRGGMGAVYLARRADETFKKNVAVKVLKRGTDTDEVLRRFHAERQIVARLEHPNIARLIDAGTTGDGLPYFVMEYVDGKPITEFCRDRNFDTRQRIKLMLAVCDAVHFAHQNLVVHRDVKPGNIVVTAEGVPKLLDFGIAKLLSDSPEAAVTIETRQRLTPGYASPEQVRGEPITTASDVYSLGALLYELLTGQTPHRFATRNPSATELLRVTAEQEIARTQLPADLDNILRTALCKEPARRYSGVAAFADDLQRYLNGMPVRARRDTVSYRAGKFIIRHKLGVGLASLTLISLLAGIVATDVQRRRAEASEEANRRLLYSAQMALAYQAWEAGNIERVVQLLEAQLPGSGQPDLRSFEWSLLWQLTHENSTIFRASGRPLRGVAFWPDGSRMVATDNDGNAHVWDLRGGGFRTFVHVVGNEEGVSLTPDGRFIAAPVGNGAVLLNADTGEVVTRFAGHTAATLNADISPDGTLLATASADGTAKLWNLAAGHELLTLAGHTDIVTEIIFSPDRHTVATTSRDRTVRLWDTRSGQQLGAFEGHTWWVVAAAFSPDGKLLASGGADGEIKLWDVARQVEVNTVRGTGMMIRTLQFSGDGKLLFAGTQDNTISIRDVATGKLLDVLRGHADLPTALAVAPGSGLLASASEDGTVRLWDVKNRAGASTFDGHVDWAWDVAYSPDGRVLASASKDGTVKLWEVETRRELLTLEHSSWVNSMSFSRDGTILATGSDDGLVRLWNCATGELVATLRGHADVVECVAFSPVKGLLVSGGKAGELIFWDPATYAEVARFSADHSKLVWDVAFSPDGRLLAVAERDQAYWMKAGMHDVKIWDIGSSKVVARLSGHTADLRALAFSPDGRTLVTGAEDRTIRLWDVVTYEQTAVFKTHSVIALSFSNDGRRLVSGGIDRTLKIWDFAAAAELCTLTLPAEPTAVAFSPHDKFLAVAGKDHKVHQWRADPPAP